LLANIRADTGFFDNSFFGRLLSERLNHMEVTAITRGPRSNTTAYAASNRSATTVASVPLNVRCADRSLLLLRAAIASMILTLILLPGGFRALNQTGMGWEAWWFSRFLILPVIGFHLLCCWCPLAIRYFKPGECRDVPAFFIATCALFIQTIIAYALFAYHSLWYSGAA
jgi:hypothetical protein